MKPSERIAELVAIVEKQQPKLNQPLQLITAIVAYLNEQHRPCECYACQEREERQAGER